MMNRSEFMFRPAQLLSDLSQAERSEALQYYQDYFDEAGPENEQQIIMELGSPEAVAASIKAGLSSEDSEKGSFQSGALQAMVSRTLMRRGSLEAVGQSSSR